MSDPHGDSAALATGIAELRGLRCEQIWCLGDLVGETDSSQTIRIARESCDLVLAGNHDLLVAGRLDEHYTESHGAEAIRRIRQRLTSDELGYLKSLPVVHESEDLQATHACLDHATDHVIDHIDADNQLALADRAFLALGHSHRAFCFTHAGGWLAEPTGLQQVGKSGLVCPGSVRPTATRRAGSVCALDTDLGACEWVAVGAAVRTPATTAA